MNDILLQAKNLGVTLNHTVILKNVSLTLSRNEIVTVIGPNGAGKTTLVKTLLGLIQPTEGSVDRLKSLKIGYMPQKLKIDTTMPVSVRRFLSLVNAAKMDVMKVLNDVGVNSISEVPLQSVSGGELQRVLLARALLKKPDLLVLDEPVQGVDINGQTELYDLISNIKNNHACGILMVSHDLHVVMAKTDKVVCLNQHICCQGHPESVSADPAYQELFGLAKNDSIAIYTHHHDHSHDMHGNIVNTDQQSHSSHD